MYCTFQFFLIVFYVPVYVYMDVLSEINFIIIIIVKLHNGVTSFPAKKSKWCSIDQVCQGVKCKALSAILKIGCCAIKEPTYIPSLSIAVYDRHITGYM